MERNAWNSMEIHTEIPFLVPLETHKERGREGGMDGWMMCFQIVWESKSKNNQS